MFRGFFNRMYNGNPNRPDLNPGDMPKNRFELFFTTLGVRLGDLIKLNLLFIVFILPLIIWTVLSIMAMNVSVQGITDVSQVTDAVKSQVMGTLQTYLLFNIVILTLAGPPLAGLVYVTRNYARDEHAWLWSDFKEQMKANWKQSMAMMFILAVVLYVSLVTNTMYNALIAVQDQAQSWMWIMQLLFNIFVGVFISSYMYAFPLLVTYKLKLGQIIRNSLMLALGRLPFTILFAVFTALPVVLGLFFSFITGYAILVLVIYYVLIGFALAAFILNSYTNATFDKLMKAEADRENPHVDPEDREIKP